MDLARACVALGLCAVVGAGCGLGLAGLGPATLGSRDGGADAAGADVTLDAEDAGEPQEAAPAEAASGDSSVVTITTVGAVTQPTGLAQETHLVWANHSARWWLFWVDAGQPGQLQATSSPDFVTWTDATPLALPASHAEQGGNFSVAYADLGGQDVVHITLDLQYPDPYDQRHFHARATLAGAAILYGPPAQLTMVTNPALTPPDGPATVVTADGHVFDATGLTTVADGGSEVAWGSTGTDMGTSWDGHFGPPQTVATAPYPVSARAFASFGTGLGAGLLALWELADEEDPTNVAWSSYGVLGWGAPANLFPPDAQSANDWDVAVVAANDVRVVRRSLDGTFDHVRYDGNSWTTLVAPPQDPGLAGSGVVLLTSGSHVAVVAIAGDAASSVRMIVWDGSAWGAWSTLEGSPATRRYLSAWSSPGHAAVLWTQSSSLALDIAGETVSF